MHWAGGAVFQAPGVVRVRVRENDRAGSEPFKPSEPIKAAINHHLCATIPDQQRTVHAMPRRPRFDFPACAQEREFHRSTLILLSGRGAIYRVGIQDMPRMM